MRCTCSRTERSRSTRSRSSSTMPRRHPGALNYGSAGVGSSGHIAGELFKKMTGTDIVHIPYNGAGPAANGVIGGHVQLLFTGMSQLQGAMDSGLVKLLGAGCSERNKTPVKTICEQGVPGFEFAGVVGGPGSSRHAEADRREAQRGLSSCRGGSRDPETLCRDRRQFKREYTRRARQACPFGNGEAQHHDLGGAHAAVGVLRLF